jgi:hypothetical protein
LAATILLSSVGFGLLALSQKAHRSALPRALPPLPSRLAGAALLAASLAPAVVRDGWMFGTVLWITVLAIAAGVVVVLLVKRPPR